MADFQLIPVVATVSGMTLLYCAVTNRKPVEVVKLALTGGNPADASPMFVDSSALKDGKVGGKLPENTGNPIVDKPNAAVNSIPGPGLDPVSLGAKVGTKIAEGITGRSASNGYAPTLPTNPN